MHLIKRKYYILLLITLLTPLLTVFAANNTPFTVVLDAGHGGYDSGAPGKITVEKNINLSVVLKLGTLIEKNHKDVKIVYTRDKDKYLTLQQRADIANENKADLFICIHTNAAKNPTAFGAETFTLGIAKTKANMEVAMRENKVMLLEEDYKTKYKGFDPSSVDSYIMFEFMQDKYTDQSVNLASKVQQQFVKYCNRSDRGVRQAEFWVLHRTAAPSILVELGFISNREEERYLHSKDGQIQLAEAIYKAFAEYKHEHEKKSGVMAPTTDNSPKQANIIETVNTDTAKVKEEFTENSGTEDVIKNNSTQKPVYKVQLFVNKTRLNENARDFKGLKDIEYYYENGLYKYTIGSDINIEKIQTKRKQVVSLFPDAFIVAFLEGKRITLSEAQNLK